MATPRNVSTALSSLRFSNARTICSSAERRAYWMWLSRGGAPTDSCGAGLILCACGWVGGGDGQSRADTVGCISARRRIPHRRGGRSVWDDEREVARPFELYARVSLESWEVCALGAGFHVAEVAGLRRDPSAGQGEACMALQQGACYIRKVQRESTSALFQAGAA
jgi:hypothetical protein